MLRACLRLGLKCCFTSMSKKWSTERRRNRLDQKGGIPGHLRFQHHLQNQQLHTPFLYYHHYQKHATFASTLLLIHPSLFYYTFCTCWEFGGAPWFFDFYEIGFLLVFFKSLIQIKNTDLGMALI